MKAPLSRDVSRLRRPDGSVVVPPAQAEAVLRLLEAEVRRLRRDGGLLGPAVLDVLEALAHAAVEHGRAAASSVDGSVPAAAPKLVSVDIIAAQMGCSREWVRALCRKGRLPARRTGRTWLVEVAS